MLKVAKFGGSSLANAQQFEKVKNIITADPDRKVIVVSAPGKRFPGDNKITDLLYLSYAHIKYGVDYHNMLETVKDRYLEIAADLGIEVNMDDAFAEIDAKLKSGAPESYLVSRGEALCARLMAAYLGWACAEDCIYLNYDGSIDTQKSHEALQIAFHQFGGKMVVPGFFGLLPDGSTALMSRGGSDITGAVCAAALQADVYENWTDVPGILMADPTIVKDPLPIPKITYDELRELTYMGAKVLHEASVYPVKTAGIPINIRDTNHPEMEGTFIDESFADDPLDQKFYITGITGRKNFTLIDVKQDNMEVGTLRDALKIFALRGIKPEQINAGLDAFTVVIHGDVAKQSLYGIAAEIEALTGEGSVHITEGISLIACVSRRMVLRPGISGLIFGALGENNINIRLISQGAKELNILIGVADEDYEKAVQVLCSSFTKR